MKIWNKISLLIVLFLLSGLATGWTPQEIEKRLNNRYTSLDSDKILLSEAIQHVAQGSGVPLVYNVSIPQKHIEVKIVNLSLKEALEKVLSPQNLGFRLGEKGIYIVAAKEGTSTQLTYQEEVEQSLKKTDWKGEKEKKGLEKWIKEILKECKVRLEIRFVPPARNVEVTYRGGKMKAEEALQTLLAKKQYHYQIQERTMVISSQRPPTPQEIVKSKKLIAKARRAFTGKKIDEAIELMDKALALNRTNFEDRVTLAHWLWIRGKFSRMERVLEITLKGLKKEKPRYRARLLMGRLLAAQGKSKKALKTLKKLLSEDRYNMMAAITAGEIAREIGEKDTSQAYFNHVIQIYQALDVDDTNSRVYALTGGACHYLNREEDALNMFNWSLEKEPFQPFALYYQGLHYLKQKKYQRAESSLKKVIKGHHYYLPPRLALARTAWRQQKTKEVREILKKALSINPSLYKGYYLEGKIALAENKFARAQALFEKALSIKKDYLAARLHQAACYKILGRKQDLRTARIRMKKLYPHLNWSRELAKILRGRKLSALQEANLAWNGGKYEEAKKAFSEIWKKDSSNYLAAIGLARVDFFRGRYKESSRRLKNILKKTQQEWEAWSLLVRNHQRQGRYKEAVQTASRAIKVFPNRPLFYTLRGFSYRAQGKLKEAKSDFKKAISFDASSRVSDLVAKGRALHALNRPHDANSTYYKAEEVDPTDARALYHHSLLFIEKYDYGYADKLLKKLFSVNSNHPLGHIAKAQSEMGDHMGGARRYLRARRHLKKALAVNPHLEEAHLLLAQLSLLDGDLQKARKKASVVFAINPKSLTAYAIHGAYYYLRGQEKKFKSTEEKVLTINPAGAEFYTFLAQVVEGHFLYQQAAEFAQKAINVDRENWRAYTILGLNLLRLGKEKKGREILEIAHKADKFNVRVYNTLELLDDYGKKYKVYKIHPKIRVRMTEGEAKVLLPYIKELIDRLLKEIAPRYGYKLEKPLTFEFFSSHQDFSVRTLGVPFIGALGVCFGNVVALDSPKALPKGNYNWSRTFWHEFIHIMTLDKTGHRIPRWFTEGLSVYEESKGDPSWDREYEKRFLQVFHQGRTRGILDLNSGFTRPRYRDEVMVCYYQGGLVVEYIVKNWDWSKIPAMLKAYRNLQNTEGVIRNVLKTTPEAFDRGFRKFVKERFQDIKIGPSYGPRQVYDFKQKVRQNPKSATWQARLALAYFFSGKTVDAEIAAGKALRLEKDSALALTAIGLIEARQGNLKGAKKHLKAALAGDTPFAYLVNKTLSSIYLKEKDQNKGLKYLEKAVGLYPRDLKSLYKLVKLYKIAGKKEKALQTRIKIVEIYERDLPNRNYLINYYRAKKDWDKVARLAESALHIDPYNPSYHKLLGKIYRERKDYKKALREYKAVLGLKKSPSPDLLVEIGQLYLDMGDRQNAADYAMKALDIDPNYRPAKALLRKARGN